MSECEGGITEERVGNCARRFSALVAATDGEGRELTDRIVEALAKAPIWFLEEVGEMAAALSGCVDEATDRSVQMAGEKAQLGGQPGSSGGSS